MKKMKKYCIALGILCLANNALAGRFHNLIWQAFLQLQSKYQSNLSNQDLLANQNSQLNNCQSVPLNEAEASFLNKALSEWDNFYENNFPANWWNRNDLRMSDANFRNAMYDFFGTKDYNVPLWNKFTDSPMQIMLDEEYWTPGITIQKIIDNQQSPKSFQIKIEDYIFQFKVSDFFFSEENQQLEELLKIYNMVTHFQKVADWMCSFLNKGFNFKLRSAKLQLPLSESFLQERTSIDSKLYKIPEQHIKNFTPEMWQKVYKVKREAIDIAIFTKSIKKNVYKVEEKNIPALIEELWKNIFPRWDLVAWVATLLNRHALQLYGSQAVVLSKGENINEIDKLPYMKQLKMNPLGLITEEDVSNNVGTYDISNLRITERIVNDIFVTHTNEKAMWVIKKAAWAFKSKTAIKESELSEEHKKKCFLFLKSLPLKEITFSIFDQIELMLKEFLAQIRGKEEAIIKFENLIQSTGQALEQTFPIDFKTINSLSQDFGRLSIHPAQGLYIDSEYLENFDKDMISYIKDKIKLIEQSETEMFNAEQLEYLQMIQKAYPENNTWKQIHNELYKAMGEIQGVNLPNMHNKFMKKLDTLLSSPVELMKKVLKNSAIFKDNDQFSVPFYIEGIKIENFFQFVLNTFTTCPIKQKKTDIETRFMRYRRDKSDPVPANFSFINGAIKTEYVDKFVEIQNFFDQYDWHVIKELNQMAMKAQEKFFDRKLFLISPSDAISQPQNLDNQAVQEENEIQTSKNLLEDNELPQKSTQGPNNWKKN